MLTLPRGPQELALASASRTEIVLTTDGDPSAMAAEQDDGTDDALRKMASKMAGPSKEAVALFVPHVVDFGESRENKKAASVNAHFKLLMTLLKWEKQEGESRISIARGSLD